MYREQGDRMDTAEIEIEKVREAAATKRKALELDASHREAVSKRFWEYIGYDGTMAGSFISLAIMLLTGGLCLYTYCHHIWP